MPGALILAYIEDPMLIVARGPTISLASLQHIEMKKTLKALSLYLLSIDLDSTKTFGSSSSILDIPCVTIWL